MMYSTISIDDTMIGQSTIKHWCENQFTNEDSLVQPVSFDRRPVNPKAGLLSRKSSRGQTPTGTSNWALWKTHNASNASCLYCVTRAKLFFFVINPIACFCSRRCSYSRPFFSFSGAGKTILWSLQTHRSPSKKQLKGALSVSVHRKVKYIILTQNSQQERLKLEAGR